MPIEQVLIEYAKSQLLLVQANNKIAQLEAKIKELTTPVEPAPKSE